jgi:hypothetical protein
VILVRAIIDREFGTTPATPESTDEIVELD